MTEDRDGSIENGSFPRDSAWLRHYKPRRRRSLWSLDKGDKLSVSDKAVGVGRDCGGREFCEDFPPGRRCGTRPARRLPLKMLSAAWQDDPRAVRLLLESPRRWSGRAYRMVRHLIPILSSSVRESPLFVVMPWLEGRTLGE